MNLFHSFCESLYNRTVREAKLHGIFVFFCVFLLSTIYFICIQIFNNCRNNFQKYHGVLLPVLHVCISFRKSYGTYSYLLLSLIILTGKT